jgi:xanthine dehydrogenase accessory factor
MAVHPVVNSLLKQAINWINEGQEVAFATVIGTWGSSPRPIGSQLIINGKGEFVGSVSGGCIEGAVIGEALNTISDGENRILSFGVTNDEAWEVGLACGGDIRILVENSDSIEILRQIMDEMPFATITNLNSKNKIYHSQNNHNSTDGLSENLLNHLKMAVKSNIPRLIMDNDEEIFIQVYNKPLRCAIIGAVHISQALIPMAKVAGFDVLLIDPRGSFATEERFPNVDINDGWPDDAMLEFNADNRSAVVTLTHDPKLDDPALEVALKSKAFYIGSLGSRRTHAARIERLTDKGYSKEDLSRINAPVGLDIGAKSPSEIAVSILAEIISVKYTEPGAI